MHRMLVVHAALSPSSAGLACLPVTRPPTGPAAGRSGGGERKTREGRQGRSGRISIAVHFRSALIDIQQRPTSFKVAAQASVLLAMSVIALKDCSAVEVQLPRRLLPRAHCLV
jgi:hypothetical protein